MYKAVNVDNVYKAFFRTVHPYQSNPGHSIGYHRTVPGTCHPGFIVVLDHISFSVERGEIFGLVGASGSGKSTMIRLLAGLLTPDDGEICIFGYNLASHPQQIQRQINNVSGHSSFFRGLSPLENLIYCTRMSGLSASETRTQAQELLEMIGIDRHEHEKPLSGLSHAVLQKIWLVHALLSCPRLLLLDEPTTGLDKDSKQTVQKMIQDYNHEHGTTVFVTLNDREDAEKFCSRIAQIQAGKLVDGYPYQQTQDDDLNDQVRIIQEAYNQEHLESVQV